MKGLSGVKMKIHDALKLLPKCDGNLGWAGEHRLYISVLIRAISDTHKPLRVYNEARLNLELIKAEAKNWFKYEDIGTITFRMCCEALSDDPEGFKEAVLKRIEEQANGNDIMQAALTRTQKNSKSPCGVKIRPPNSQHRRLCKALPI